MQASQRPPDKMDCWMFVASRAHLRAAFPASAACLPGEKARWMAQSEYASAMAAGDRPAVRRAREEWTILSNVSERRSSGSGGQTVADGVTGAPSGPVFVKGEAKGAFSALGAMEVAEVPLAIVFSIAQECLRFRGVGMT
ncbi:protein of unknown function (plasmid) [Methylocella tundrae]|uniref:Uncharacterized protein n=1 Tax=Methylocella tundrae TaxID=227605 RepID=A0A4U8Z7K3_METTU|nr:protein of unknown function [Methylocella tundrae]